MKTAKENKKVKIDEKESNAEFPGYPLYPANEDIMNQGQRVEADLENANTAHIIATDDVLGMKTKKTKAFKDSEVTKEDLEALGPKDLSMDMGDDEDLKHRVYPVNFSSSDLDIPASELDDAAEAIGSEDEENNSYSLGGDNHEDLEEDKS